MSEDNRRIQKQMEEKERMEQDWINVDQRLLLERRRLTQKLHMRIQKKIHELEKLMKPPQEQLEVMKQKLIVLERLLQLDRPGQEKMERHEWRELMAQKLAAHKRMQQLEAQGLQLWKQQKLRKQQQQALLAEPITLSDFITWVGNWLTKGSKKSKPD